MLKITLCILFLATNVNGEDVFCNCSCEGTKEGVSLCDKVTGKCECKPGFSGERCQTCIQVVPSRRSCKTCDCPTVNNKCKETAKFNLLSNKFIKLNKVDFKPADQPAVNKTQIEDLKSKIQKLLDDIKTEKGTDFAPVEKLQKGVLDIVHNIRELLKKYKNEDLLGEDENKLVTGLKIVEDILSAIKDVEGQDKIQKMLKDAESIMKNVTRILKEHDKCLDVIDQFCSGKNTTALLDEVKTQVGQINVDPYFNRIQKNKEDTKKALEVDQMNQKDLSGIEIPKIPEFDEVNYKHNHKQLEWINRNINEIDNIEKKVTDLHAEANKKKKESDFEKGRALNTILMAPVPEIQETIDNITNTINNSHNLLDDLKGSNIKLEEAQQKIDSELEAMGKELRRIEKEIDKIKSELTLYVPSADSYEIHLKLVMKMKENLLNLTAEYKKKIDEIQTLEREMEEGFEKMRTVLEAEIECMKNATKQADEKIKADDELLDALERDLDNAKEAAVLLGQIEEVETELERVKGVSGNLNEIEDIKGKPDLCPKHDLS